MTQRQEISFISDADYQSFSALEQQPFDFSHTLQKSPLMDINALYDLSRFIQEKNLPHLIRNDSKQRSGWGVAPEKLTLVEGFGKLKAGNILIMLKSVQSHPDYKIFLQRFLEEIGDIRHIDMRKEYRRPICTIIIASPRRVTPYHVDDSHNLLMQVRGRKDFYVFDGTDPEIVTAEEREAFWNGDASAAQLTEAKQTKATLHSLAPGIGVHVPFLYPHWAQNGTDVSIAVSVNFQSVSDRALSVHDFNNFLRSRGLHPSAPGRSKLIDLSKCVAFEALSAIRGLRNHYRPDS